MDSLIDSAANARDNAYCPYSKFRVGAAVLCDNGSILSAGCNVENVSYGATVCAERVALFNAVSSGRTKFRAIAI
uniref:CMP/dCMP-type deaminase domain-containing protein n=1 Tax=Capitella teleta TaxID=283909 RepID=X1Z459_CAPTE